MKLHPAQRKNLIHRIKDYIILLTELISLSKINSSQNTVIKNHLMKYLKIR